MNEALAINIVQFLWGLILGLSFPLAILYVMRSIKVAGLSGWRYLLGLIKRIAIAIFVLFMTVGLITVGMEWIMSMLTAAVEPMDGLELTTGYLIGSNIGLFGGIALLVIGYRKGRKTRRDTGPVPS